MCAEQHNALMPPCPMAHAIFKGMLAYQVWAAIGMDVETAMEEVVQPVLDRHATELVSAEGVARLAVEVVTEALSIYRAQSGGDS